MSNLQAFWTFLTGKKTYLVAAASLLYLVGIDYGWWHHSLTLDGILGSSLAASFRHAISVMVDSAGDPAAGTGEPRNASAKPTSPTPQN